MGRKPRSGAWLRRGWLPPELLFTEAEIQSLSRDKRKPGQSKYTTQRRERIRCACFPACFWARMV
ncbi:hypothetical protein VXQ18_05845 [Brucella abortus]|nr:hypothetical protein [Brucella abortus]